MAYLVLIPMAYLVLILIAAIAVSLTVVWWVDGSLKLMADCDEQEDHRS